VRQPQPGGFYEIFPATVDPLQKTKKSFQKEHRFQEFYQYHEDKNPHQDCGGQ
jgi:hypothetical protein